MNNQHSGIRIGIDAANIRLGGGVTHLIELLGAIDPVVDQIDQIYIWGGQKTLAVLPERDWLKKINPPILDKGIWRRIFWQSFCLSKVAKTAKCDVLLVPGGSYVGSFYPVVTMSQNLFPFEWSAISKNGFSLRALKFMFLRLIQSFSFKRSQGVIFLTQYAKHTVLKVTGPLHGKTAVIAHGIHPHFERNPKPQLSITQYSQDNPFELLYVSIVDVYKHQPEVVLAVDQLRRKGYPLSLTLIGPSEPRAMRALEEAQFFLRRPKEWLYYLGAVPHQELITHYQKADLGIFASSCETFGMVVLEKMMAGLPIACSEQSSMHEILGEAGLYFDPRKPADIAKTIEKYLLSTALREQKSMLAYALAKKYSWKKSANSTIAFLHQVKLLREL
jgi:glycosyltransferase involved in cell wall biosynthesis